MAHFSLPAARLAMNHMAITTSLCDQIQPSKIGTNPSLLNSYLDLVSYYKIACQVEKHSEHTISNYESSLKQFAVYASENKYPTVDKLTSYHIRMYLLSLQQRGLKDVTVNKHYRCLQTFFKWLIAEKVTENWPLNNVPAPKFPKRTPTVFTKEELNNMLTVLSGGHFTALRNRAIILMYLDTGLRLAELSGLKISDIDWKRFTIHVIGKGDKERTVSIQRKTQKALIRYMVARRDIKLPWLWLTESKKPLTYWGVKQMVRDLMEYAGIKGHGKSHKFRHTFAVNALKNGCDLYTLQRWLGHTNPKTTEIYLGALSTDDLVIKHQSFSPVEKMDI